MGWNRLLPFFRKEKEKKEETPASAAAERDETRRGLQESICQWRLADRDAEPVSSLPALSLAWSSLARPTSIPLVIRTSSIQPSSTTEQRGRREREREALALLILDDNKSDKSIASSRSNLFNTHTLARVCPAVASAVLDTAKARSSPFGRFDDT